MLRAADVRSSGGWLLIAKVKLKSTGLATLGGTILTSIIALAIPFVAYVLPLGESAARQTQYCRGGGMIARSCNYRWAQMISRCRTTGLGWRVDSSCTGMRAS
jgi:hypothetical protein